MYLGATLGIPLLLTDDLAVRDAARKLGLTPVGSLGIIAKACALGRIVPDEADRHLTALGETSSLYVTRTIIEMAREELHQSLT